MPEENLKVAVRVRPFNSRETAHNSTLIVDMKGATTLLKDPHNPGAEPRSFSFDYSYWSHDGCKEQPGGYSAPDEKHPNGKKYADQKKVFSDLGVGVLNNAWEGYNSTLFAYGQTGSGKSWSVVGYGENKGIVPMFCEMLFKGIDEKKSKGEKTEYEVTFSMLEIYMEEVRDLLDSKPKVKGGLKVRQHPKKGFYAEGLTQAPVGSFSDIERKTEEGTTNRTVAATNMNATSSRAHTIVCIVFTQKFKNTAGQDTTKTAVVNLVDLAGSERAASTGATGDRLKEGAAINQSLSALGNCISALADKSGGKNVKVPYRDSVLTKLLMNALGGNSKTLMIAAISPADINYEETLSTLRYADRAKQIRTTAVVNEDPTEKLVRELQEENERLKKMLQSGGVQLSKGTGETQIEEEEGMTEEEKAALRKELEDEYKAQLAENAKQMEDMKKAFEEKLKEAQAVENKTAQMLERVGEKRVTEPHIFNLNSDPQLTGKVVHIVDLQRETVGCNKEPPCDIPLVGPSILEQHAVFTRQGDKVFLEKSSPVARVLVNGDPMTQKTEIHHNDRLLFGTTVLYVFQNPAEQASSKLKYSIVTHETAQLEIASKCGFDMTTANKSRDDMLLQEDLLDIIPALEAANAISEELKKKKKFELLLVSAEARGEVNGRSKLYVRVTDTETGHEWSWPRETFLDKMFVMKEMFYHHQQGEQVKVPPERDPFVLDPEVEVHIGSVKVWLQSLAYNVELKEQMLEITDFKGTELGMLSIDLLPCDAKGKVYTEKDDVWVDDPRELVGRDVHFTVKLNGARGLPPRFTALCAKYLVYLDTEYTCTPQIKDTSNPDWKHQKVFHFTPATEQLVDYLSRSAMMVQIWGKQKPVKKPEKKEEAKNINVGLMWRQVVETTMATLASSPATAAAAAAQNKTNAQPKAVDLEKVQVKMALVVAKTRAEKAELKVGHLRELLKAAEKDGRKTVPLELLREMMTVLTPEDAAKCLKKLAKASDKDQETRSRSKGEDTTDHMKNKNKEEEHKKHKGKHEEEEEHHKTPRKSAACTLT